MRRLVAFGVVALFGLIAMGGPVEASHQSFTVRYVIGGGGGFAHATVCIVTVQETTYAVGGACTRPCPHGTCDITVVDDHRGTNVWFRIQVNDEPFFRPEVYFHTASVLGAEVRVAPLISDATTGIITIS